MKIFLNEIHTEIDEKLTLYEVRDKYKKESDIVILNGYPVEKNYKLQESDKVSLIKRGENLNLDKIEKLLAARHTPNIHEKLKKGSVAILGLGGLGSNIAISLARIGVGELIIADYDIVEPSNLNRQQYFIDDIGSYKTSAIKNNLNNINPFINIKKINEKITKENMNLFKDADIIVEAFDNPKSKAEISNYILTNMKEKFLIASSGMAGYYDSNMIQTKKLRENFYICGDLVSEAKIGDGLMAPRVAICANHMANLVIKILVDKY
ncbi:sulfur carrier protein ThiS adenylyltransferase ThiF [Romboutsia lituseburensis]|uniref:sulfur carrier protein ThiS adenylyltransferase ThiF n=1 Tax=Romboutsia lituseburensis TaxID=1537 RepID=UPI00215A216C|nr:sulfur carrier protein ThiS adenylyltransferase ThiF [Romboutsia lituseburensis]MCR8744931.1 sulfur carrier protein ThiS adenylyltransferase ThiF [Romboutsia lituseburensis]